MRDRARVNFIVDQDHRLITIRPIGIMPKMEMIDQVFEAYAGLQAPETYRRVRDLRRWEGTIDQETEFEISRRWAEITAGADQPVLLAIVLQDATDDVRQPRVQPDFPNETICEFTDYHEAVAWLLAEDREAYLAGLDPLPFRRRHAHAIRIE